MPKKTLILLSVFIAMQGFAFAQTTFIEGRVLSSGDKHEPLAFVKITLKRTGSNAISDIDGKWEIMGANQTDTLLFSYLGYATRKIPVSDFDFKKKEQIVYLSEKEDVLGEVTIKPGANPAERIISQVISHKDENNYANIKSYAYFAFTNMHASLTTQDSASLSINNLPVLNSNHSYDTAKLRKTDKSIDSFSKKQYPFLIETVESVGYRYPGRVKKELLAYRVSGIDDARVSLFANTFENFNIYRNYIELGEKNFVSPIAETAIRNYLFIIRDTIWSPEKDTVFVISYQPRSHKTFNGFKGTIYISSRNYAVQDIIANPVSQNDGFGLRLRQQFEFVNNKHWFPVHQEVGIDFAKLSADDSHIIDFEGKSNYIDINFDTLIAARNFSDVQTTVADDAGHKDSSYWDRYRGRPLNTKESNTYAMLDSFGKIIRPERFIKLMDALSGGRIPVGKLDMDMTKLFAYNSYEKYRLGLGLYTNDKISPYFSAGGYYDYGFGDHHSKYGGSVDIKPVKGSFFQFGASYSNDVYEFGGTRFGLENMIPYDEQIRYFSINDMYSSIDKSAYVRFSLPMHLQFRCALNQSQIHTNDSYEFLSPEHIPGRNYAISEAQIGFRYAYKETIMKLPGKQMVVPYPKGPVIYFQYSKGLNNLGGNYAYDKFDLKISKKFILSTFGSANVQISSGLVRGIVPLFKEYNTPANYWVSYPIATQNAFETVRIDEFFDNKFINLFYKQTFAWHPYKNQVSAPVFSLREDIGYGQLDHNELNAGLNYKSMNKGYYESGLVIDNVLLSSFSGFGVGFFYRYGPYSLDGFKNNLAIKISFSSILLE